MRIRIVWAHEKVRGRIEIARGRIASMRGNGQGTAGRGRFALSRSGGCALEADIRGARQAPGANATLVTVRERRGVFSFFLRDVSAECPVWLPEYGVAVTGASDGRDYGEIVKALRARNLRTRLEAIEASPEESFEKAASETRNVQCPTWLGIPRDIHKFIVDFTTVRKEATHDFEIGQLETRPIIRPKLHSLPLRLAETGYRDLAYEFAIARGVGCIRILRRRLADGALPILHAELEDEDVLYRMTFFVTLEKSPLNAKTIRGTHYLVADGHAGGHMFTEEQAAAFRRRVVKELGRGAETLDYFRSLLRPDGTGGAGHAFPAEEEARLRRRAARWIADEEPVLHARIEALNRARVPRYAWFKRPWPFGVAARHDGRRGFGVFGSGRVFCIARVNGKPMPQEEMAVLVKPGRAAAFEFTLAHRPVSEARAEALAGEDVPARLAECRDYWREREKAFCDIRLPERRIEEMLRAGAHHLDLVACGREPNGPLAACVGTYSPIGSESLPIILFMDSMGAHKTARRMLDYFLAKQHDDGFMQNYGGYTLETGVVLYALGEHYRMTRDDRWAKRVAPNALKGCEYIRKWRRRNKRKDLRGKGYGLLDGRVADAIDPFHSFMLNGYACVGMQRTAELLRWIDRRRASQLAKEADAYREAIRDALHESMSRSPVVPLGDGTWCPTAPPWVEARGPTYLYATGRKNYTHGSFMARNSTTGPLWLLFQEVVHPREQAADRLMRICTDTQSPRNAALSQPYYSRHPWAHLKRGEVRAFLKAYYSTVSAMADRETYSFWEHYYGLTSHKTHEEGWFLMQSRWMLYMEEGDTLRLLPGIPRAWLRDGERLEIRKAACYFGAFSLEVESRLSEGRIEARVEWDPRRAPSAILLRLPHPQGRKAVRADGGEYEPEREAVRIAPKGRARVVVLHF